MLVRTCEGRPAPGYDHLLERALSAHDLRQALSRLDDLAKPVTLIAPLLALESMERSFELSGRKSATALAARMTRELIHRPEKLEAEWQTADRLGYSDAVVRQARRILQDFGAVRCQRGRKGAVWGAPASPAGVIRLMAPYLIATGMTTRDNAETANFLACSAPRLAAGRTAGYRPVQTKIVGARANTLEFIDLIRIENLLLELAGNPLLSIMTRSLGLANLLSFESRVGLKRLVDVVAINHRILHAIGAGDADTADLFARAKSELQQSGSDYRKLA
jgi:DNA-binding FadR family transcriptional regulator